MSLLIGLCDCSCPDKRVSPFTNKIGGLPDFFSSASLSAPPICKVCGSRLVLLIQAYCPLEGSQYHRLFHVFCCSCPSCWNKSASWLALRSQEIEKVLDDVPKNDSGMSSISVQDWCDEADDWESDAKDTIVTIIEPKLQPRDSSSIEDTPLLNLSSNSQNQTPSSYNSSSYPSFFLNVFAESEILCNSTKSNVEFSSLSSSSSNNTVECDSLETVEGYEQSIVAHGDNTFMKFKKEILKCSNQIIRYQKGGVPLLSSDINIPPPSVDCISCGGNSTFEFQIMPQLVYLLQESMGHYTSALELPGDNTLKSLEIDSYLKVVEFGTVLVYTCDKSCWIDNNLEQNCFKEEVVCVQPET